MRRLESQGVTFNACEACAGVYINPGRLNALIRQPDDQIDRGVVRQLARFGKGAAARPSSAPSCAECGVSMVPVSLRTLSPKPVPSCTSCFSLFISKDLLNDILSARRGGPQPAPAAAPAAAPPAATPGGTAEVPCDTVLARGLADRLAKARLIRTWRGMFGVSPSTGTSYLAMRFEATGRITILQLPGEPGPAGPVQRIPPDVHWAE
jgi:Zn-finger nucleic acid-binding protein